MNNKSIRFAVLTGITYLAGMGFIIWFLNSRDIGNIPEGRMWLPSYVMFAVTLICAGLMPRIPMIIWPVAVFGIGFGVVLNAFTDGQYHNLFPFEVILWAGIVTPGSLLGAAAGALIYWTRKKIRAQPPASSHAAGP
jgi:hypothetical protein